jgi:tRNA-Thr(GGU) m(6)t(6)A37 methyltransferase TsaA
MKSSFELVPVGVVRKTDDAVWLEIYEPYRDAMLGLDGFSHVMVFFWFHENDTPEGRSVLRVHPRKDPANPLTGVFATHSPFRPNLIGYSTCKVLSIDEDRIRIEDIDAIDGSPLIDLKCFVPAAFPDTDIRLPNWV